MYTISREMKWTLYTILGFSFIYINRSQNYAIIFLSNDQESIIVLPLIYCGWAIPFSPFVSSSTNGHLHGRQKVNGLRKIARASVFPSIYIYIYMYMNILKTATVNGRLFSWSANDKLSSTIAVPANVPIFAFQ